MISFYWRYLTSAELLTLNPRKKNLDYFFYRPVIEILNLVTYFI